MIADGQVAELRGGDVCHKGREWMPVPQGNRSEQSRIGQKRRGGGDCQVGGWDWIEFTTHGFGLAIM